MIIFLVSLIISIMFPSSCGTIHNGIYQLKELPLYVATIFHSLLLLGTFFIVRYCLMFRIKKLSNGSDTIKFKTEIECKENSIRIIMLPLNRIREYSFYNIVKYEEDENSLHIFIRKKKYFIMIPKESSDMKDLKRN